MTPAQQQRKAIERRAKRYARRWGWETGGIPYNTTAAAYAAGFKAGNGVAVKAPAAALRHVLDTQRELKAKIVQLRAALRMLGDTAIREASL